MVFIIIGISKYIYIFRCSAGNFFLCVDWKARAEKYSNNISKNISIKCSIFQGYQVKILFTFGITAVCSSIILWGISLFTISFVTTTKESHKENQSWDRSGSIAHDWISGQSESHITWSPAWPINDGLLVVVKPL